MPETLYTDCFFKSCTEGSLTSARKIVPYLQTLTGCRTVVDVGCGLGTWLSVFRECGITDFQGIDGAYVNQDKLLIPRDHFIAADLTNPPDTHRTYDLAICLEVAEHLPGTAETSFLDFLTRLSDVIVFSASIPFQDGTGHINEHWLEHWVAEFRSRHYVPVDCLRPYFWNDEQIEWWYSQNTIVYVRQNQLTKYPNIEAILNNKPVDPFSCVHPRLLLHKQNLLVNMPMLDAWRLAINRTWQAIKGRLSQSPASK